MQRRKGRERMVSARQSGEPTARSVWSAWSLLPRSDGRCDSKAGASSAHSIRYARLRYGSRNCTRKWCWSGPFATAMLICGALQAVQVGAAGVSKPYGLTSRPESKPYLSMPLLAGGAVPPLLSQTGAFKDAPRLVPAEGLIPYDLIVPFWSDGATKLRWMALPGGASIKFAPALEWAFPPGTVFVKTF